jgi:hypothetical protein
MSGSSGVYADLRPGSGRCLGGDIGFIHKASDTTAMAPSTHRHEATAWHAKPLRVDLLPYQARASGMRWQIGNGQSALGENKRLEVTVRHEFSLRLDRALRPLSGRTSLVESRCKRPLSCGRGHWPFPIGRRQMYVGE